MSSIILSKIDHVEAHIFNPDDLIMDRAGDWCEFLRILKINPTKPCAAVGGMTVSVAEGKASHQRAVRTIEISNGDDYLRAGIRPQEYKNMFGKYIDIAFVVETSSEEFAAMVKLLEDDILRAVQ